VVSDFLFHPETIEQPGFDPAPVVDLWDTVSRQDWELCERVQLGVGSRAFTSGVYPRQDRLVHLFAERYREWMGVPSWDAVR
jgi:glycine betaine catabolism A